MKKTMTTWTRRVTLGAIITMNLALGAWAVEPPIDGTKEGNIAATASTRSEEKPQSLPFTVTITDMKKDKYPDYMWTKYRRHMMDFPPTIVNIGSEVWLFTRNGAGGNADRYKGTNVEELIQQPGGRLLSFPASVQRPYMFGGMWYDASEGKLYQPMHCEYKRGFGFVRQIHLTTSTDKGATWQYVGPIMTSFDDGGKITDGRQYAGNSWDGGEGDSFQFVDERGGYVYIYASAYAYGKGPGNSLPALKYHVARCAMTDKMAPGKWRKFYNGAWNEPALGGRATPVNGFSVMYNTYLQKYISFTYGNGLAICSDLSKQDWSRKYRMKGDCWGYGGSKKQWFWIVVDEKKHTNLVGDRTLFLYRGEYNTDGIRIVFGTGETSGSEGYVHPFCGGWVESNDPSIPDQPYALTPRLESGDPIEARRTHPCEERDITVAKDKATGQVRSIQARFKASEIYWRALLDQATGKVDIYIDEQFQRTVNLYSPTPTDLLIPFYKTGLDPSKTHTIKIVVRDDQDPRAIGKLVKSKWFEYSAETYLASDGFSAIMGKEQWHYLQGRDGKYEELKFPLSDLGQKFWTGSGGCSIGPNTMNSGSEENNEVARKWLAPHDGMVRLEGSPGAQRKTEICIFKNQEVIYPLQTPTKGYDVRIPVKKNDAIYFVVRSGLCQWDPRVTYVDATGDGK